MYKRIFAAITICIMLVASGCSNRTTPTNKPVETTTNNSTTTESNNEKENNSTDDIIDEIPENPTTEYEEPVTEPSGEGMTEEVPSKEEETKPSTENTKPEKDTTSKKEETTTQKPTSKPTEKPTQKPTVKPTEDPTQKPTQKPEEETSIPGVIIGDGGITFITYTYIDKNGNIVYTSEPHVCTPGKTTITKLSSSYVTKKLIESYCICLNCNKKVDNEEYCYNCDSGWYLDYVDKYEEKYHPAIYEKAVECTLCCHNYSYETYEVNE